MLPLLIYAQLLLRYLFALSDISPLMLRCALRESLRALRHTRASHTR